MSKIAIDFPGTLDTHNEIEWIVIDLARMGWEVVILSAMPVTMRGIREKEIETFLDEFICDIPYKVVYHELDNYHEAAGREKAIYMKDHDIGLLIDDNQIVADTVRKMGLKVLLI